MQSNSDFTEELDFQKYFLVLKRRWLPATVTFTAIVTLALAAAISRRPIYKAEGQVLIQSDRSARLAGLNNEYQLGNIELLTDKSDPLSTEAEILSSRPIAEKTIAQLQLKYQEGKLASVLKFFGLGEKKQQDNLISSEVFLNNLSVKPNKGTDLLQVSYKDKDPEVAAAVVNKTIELYKENDTLSHRAEAAAAREFIAKQLPQVEANASQAERELRLFKNKNQLADLSRETSNTIDYIKDLENEIDRTTIDLEDVGARSQQLRNQIGMDLDSAKTFISLSQSAGVQRVLNELQEVKVKLAQESNRFSDKTPQVASLREQEAELNRLLEQQVEKTLAGKQVSLDKLNLLNYGALRQQQIAEFVNIEVQRSGLQKRLSGFKNAVITRKKALNHLPGLEGQQKELEQKAKAAQSTYQTLLNRLQEAQVVENQNVGNVRVVAQAVVPKAPSEPNRPLIFMAGLFSGACLGVAVAFLLDLMDNSVKTVKEAEELFGYTFQGVIPDFGKLVDKKSKSLPSSDLSDRLVATNDISITPVMDAFQMLQANLKLFNSTKDQRVIAVTSSIAQEGKSSVSANLASAIAQVGRRVVLVDADMRRPRQQQIWKLSEPMGLSDVLRGEVQLQQAIQHVTPNLDVLSAGTIPPNPVVLIDSPRMRQLISTLGDNYDYIIFDTPPLSGMADTTLLGRMVDGVLMVVRPNFLDSASAIAAKKLLLNTNQNIVGMVANYVDTKNEPTVGGYFYQPDEKYQTQNR